MKFLFCTCAAALASLLVSCSSSPEMEAVAARVQKTRIDNALYAKAARIRVWKDTSTKDKHGWHIHSEQENKIRLTENEFKTARYLFITQGRTIWCQQTTAPATLTTTAEPHIIELEWLNASGLPTGSIDVLRIIRESQRNGIVTSDFPVVLKDDAYEQFFALPTIDKALMLIEKGH